MKKLILSAIALTGLTVASFGQGVINFDGGNNTSTSPTATTEGSLFINGVLDTTTDVNATLLGGTSAGTLVPIVTLLLSDTGNPTVTSLFGSTQPALGDITSIGGGNIWDNSGNAYQFSGNSGSPQIAAGITAFFEIEAWTGNYSTYAAAVASGLSTVYFGTSAVFTEPLASAAGTEQDLENAPALNLLAATPTPEPTTMALAGLGSLSLYLMRRKK
jgi:PEP-CTERM motif